MPTLWEYLEGGRELVLFVFCHNPPNIKKVEEHSGIILLQVLNSAMSWSSFRSLHKEEVNKVFQGLVS